MTPTDYAQQIVALFPRGRLWDWANSKLFGSAQVIADEMLRVDGDIVAAREEADTRTIVGTLAQWEEMYGLPSTGSDAERLARIQSKVLTRRRTRPADYRERFAAVLALPSSQIVVVEFFSGAEPVLTDARQHYRFALFRDPALSGTYSWQDAQLLLDEYQHSHTDGKVVESLAFRTDDPYSLTDRDILEYRHFYGPRIVAMKGDDAANVDDGAGRYISLSNSGRFGSEFTSDTTARRPYVASMGGLPCPRWLDDADQKSALVDASLTATAFLHQSGTSATVSMLFRVEDSPDACVILSNLASARGFQVETLGNAGLRLTVKASSSFVLSLDTAAGSCGVGDRLIQVTKVGLLYTIYIDGVSAASASASSLDADGTSQVAVFFGSPALGVPGLLPEVIIRDYALTGAELASERVYLERWGKRSEMQGPVVWWRGDDPDAVVSGGRYVSIPNRGSWGGSLTPDGGTAPQSLTYAGKTAPFFAAATSEQLVSKRTPAAQFLELASMHMSGTGGTLLMVVDVGAAGTSESILSDNGSSATAIGVYLNRSATDRAIFQVGNGASAAVAVTTGASTMATGRFVVAVRKAANSFELFLDGTLAASGTASGLSTASAALAATVFSPTCDAYMPEFLAWNFALSNTELAEKTDYLSRWTP